MDGGERFSRFLQCWRARRFFRGRTVDRQGNAWFGRLATSPSAVRCPQGFPLAAFGLSPEKKWGIFDNNASKAVALGGHSKTLNSGEVARLVPNHRAVRLRVLQLSGQRRGGGQPSMTRQMPYEPLAAFFLVGLVCMWDCLQAGQLMASPACGSNSSRDHRDQGSCADT